MHSSIRRDIERAIASVLDSGQFLYGSEVEAFEEEFADFVGARYAVSVGSGLAALTLTLRAWNIGPGDEVIVPAHTFIATWLAVSAQGATIVPVDADPQTCNLDPLAVARAVGPRTRAIIPVHLYGTPAELDAILQTSQGRRIKVLQDAAQAHGARYRGQPLGSFGDAAAWSFYPAKNLGALGDGGAMTTNDHDLARELRTLRNYGSEQKYVHLIQGENSRLSSLNAAVLRVKLRHLEEWNQRRREIAGRYLKELQGCQALPHWPEHTDPVWHLFVIQDTDRDGMARYLADRGVETMIHYPVPPHRQPAYAELCLPRGRLPVAESLCQRVLSLPMGPHLRDRQVRRVIEAVNEFQAARSVTAISERRVAKGQ